jgi:phage shock protein A
MRTKVTTSVELLQSQHKHELEHLSQKYESEIVQLEDQVVTLIREKQQLNHKIELLQDQLIKVEHIKISEGASSRVWKAISALGAALGALLMSIFDRNDK